MNNTKNPTAQQSQKWILEALLGLMKDTPYDKLSVSEICRRAEVDRRTFYRNFNSKNEVLEDYIKYLGSEYMAEFNRTANIDRYAATLLFFVFWEKHISFIQDMKKCGLSDFIFSEIEKFVCMNKVLLVEEAKDKQNGYISAYQIGGFWNAMQTWAWDNNRVSPVEMAGIVCSLIGD